MSIGALKLSCMLSKNSFVPTNLFCTGQFEVLPIRVSAENNSEGIRYMDSISRLFYRNFTLINCNSVYPSALELQNGSWITNDRRIRRVNWSTELTELTVPYQRVNVNWSTSTPMEGFFNDQDLEPARGPKD